MDKNYYAQERVMSNTRVRVIDIPGELALVLHLLMVGNQTLAIAASRQPKEVRGKKPKDLLNRIMDTALIEFSKKPPQEQERLLKETMKSIGRMISLIEEAEHDSP